MCDKEHINKNDVAHCLAKIRRGWEEADCSQDLDNVKGSVGLLLNDVEEVIGFDPDEIRETISREIVVK